MRPNPSRVSAFRNCFGTIWSVSTFTRSSGATFPVCVVNGCIRFNPPTRETPRYRQSLSSCSNPPVAFHLLRSSRRLSRNRARVHRIPSHPRAFSLPLDRQQIYLPISSLRILTAILLYRPAYSVTPLPLLRTLAHQRSGRQSPPLPP